jgi:DNA-directed RNA polymerase omega subunit
MVNKPSIDKLTAKAGDKYTLCCVIAKRAKQLNNNQDNPQNFKPISTAANEFADGETELKD